MLHLKLNGSADDVTQFINLNVHANNLNRVGRTSPDCNLFSRTSSLQHDSTRLADRGQFFTVCEGKSQFFE